MQRVTQLMVHWVTAEYAKINIGRFLPMAKLTGSVEGPLFLLMVNHRSGDFWCKSACKRSGAGGSERGLRD